jgi:peptidoglycan/xylan/chitin deacetylase (PgdA/CDA1 family)
VSRFLPDHVPSFSLSRRAVLVQLAGLAASGRTIAAEAGPSLWPTGAVSLTYDDGLASQLDLAMPALNAHGLHGTFYISWVNMARRAADWVVAGHHGHEIANHSMLHLCDLGRFSPDQYFAREIAPMEAWLDRSFGPARLRSFAYPCDVTNLGGGSANAQAHRYAERLKQAGILSGRTSEGLPNSAAHVRRAPYRLQALALGYDTASLDDVRAYLALAKAHGAWAILVIHDVVPRVTEAGQISQSDHEALLDMVSAAGLRCAPVGEIVKDARAYPRKLLNISG